MTSFFAAFFDFFLLSATLRLILVRWTVVPRLLVSGSQGGSYGHVPLNHTTYLLLRILGIVLGSKEEPEQSHFLTERVCNMPSTNQKFSFTTMKAGIYYTARQLGDKPSLLTCEQSANMLQLHFAHRTLLSPTAQAAAPQRRKSKPLACPRESAPYLTYLHESLGIELLGV